MRHGLPVIAVLLLASTNLAALNPPGLEMQVTRSKRGLPVVSVRAGAETLRLGLDTGTSRSLVSVAVAERLGLRPSSRFALGDAAGESRGGLCAPAPLLRLGDVTIALECLAWIPEEPDVAGAEGLDGLLGADILAQLDLWIDLTGDLVRLRAAPPGSLARWTDGTRLPLERIGRRHAIAAQIRLGRDTAAARLVLDSGSDGLILFGDLAHRTAGALRKRGIAARIETATGTREVSMVPLMSLRSGPLVFDAGWAGLLPHVVDRPEDGLLPLSALGPVLLDVSNGIVVARARLRPTTQRARPS
jgi:hypothetical protein